MSISTICGVTRNSSPARRSSSGIVVLVVGVVATQALMAVGVIVSVTGFVVMVTAAGRLYHSRSSGS